MLTTADAGEKLGAQGVRAIFGHAYADPTITGILLSVSPRTHACVSLGPEHRTKLIAEYGRDVVEAEGGDWGKFFYEKRSDMMLKAN